MITNRDLTKEHITYDQRVCDEHSHPRLRRYEMTPAEQRDHIMARGKWTKADEEAYQLDPLNYRPTTV